MARKRKQQIAVPQAGKFLIDTGTAELVRDRYTPNGWLLYINDVQSSHIDLSSKFNLDFEYMRYMAKVIESQFNPRVEQKINFLHLGGGGCSLPRYMAYRYPVARHVVVELDAKLIELVRNWFDLPSAPQMRIRAGEAREVVESLSENSRDVIIRDVFAGPVTPRELLTVEFVAHIKRVLRPEGLYIINCGDGPKHSLVKAEISALLANFKNVSVISDSAMLKGKRYGNIVLVASDVKIGSPSLGRILRTDPIPAQLWGTGKAKEFIEGVQYLEDLDL
ncbi:MAG: fused MFS/spermidine synthase [Micrococcaceae bacterium]